MTARGADHVLALRRALDQRRPIALFGAGLIGRECVRALRALGHEPVCVADETPARIGTTCEGAPVLAPADAARQVGASGLMMCSFYRPVTSLAATCRRVAETTGRRTIPFLPLFQLAPGSFSCTYAFGPLSPEADAELEAGLRWLAARLSDEASRSLLDCQIEFRRSLDPSVLPAPTPYFDPLASQAPLLDRLLFDRLVFVDCGAFDGDTIAAFLAATGGRYRRIIALEPDQANAAALRARAAELLGGRIADFVCHEKGVWSHEGVLGFSATGTPASAISADGTQRIAVTALDTCVDARGDDVVMLKLDVEGAEAEALRGAAQLLRRPDAVACVSVYHRPADLAELPRLLDAQQPGHRLLLRSHGHDGADLVVYTLPP
jgi:FkbM family methyltransferase